jgi:hypothetical protein
MVKGYLIQVIVKRQKYFLKFPYAHLNRYDRPTYEGLMDNATLFKDETTAEAVADQPLIRSHGDDIPTIIPYKKELTINE